MPDHSQRDDSRYRRMIEAVLASPDPERHRAVEAELAEHPELLREYRRLRVVWAELGRLPPGVPPEGAEVKAGAALRESVARAGGGEGRVGMGRSAVDRRHSDPAPRRRRRVLEAVAGLVVFLAGAMVGIWVDADEPPPSPGIAEVGPVYALLIRGGDPPDEASPAREAMAGWARGLSAQGRLIWAGELLPEQGVRTDGRPASAEGEIPLGGIFLVRAEDRTAALRLARDAPHLAWGGNVEVVPVAHGR